MVNRMVNRIRLLKKACWCNFESESESESESVTESVSESVSGLESSMRAIAFACQEFRSTAPDALLRAWDATDDADKVKLAARSAIAARHWNMYWNTYWNTYWNNNTYTYASLSLDYIEPQDVSAYDYLELNYTQDVSEIEHLEIQD